MNIVKLGTDCYVNLDRVTFVEADRKRRLIVHFAVGGGDVGGPPCQVRLEGPEADAMRRCLDLRSGAGE